MFIETRSIRYRRFVHCWLLLLGLLLVAPPLAEGALTETGDEGGLCGPGQFCGGQGVSCLNTNWGLRCVKCGGKGERGCNPINMISGAPCESDLSFIGGVCRVRTSDCGHPGYRACTRPGGAWSCHTGILGKDAGGNWVCLATGRCFQRWNQGGPRCDSLQIVEDVSGQKWRYGCAPHPSGFCLPVPRKLLTPTTPAPPNAQPQPSGQVDNLPYKKDFSRRCEKMRSGYEDIICRPITSGCAQVAMGCTGYVITGGLPDTTSASRSTCGKALLEKYLSCVAECNARLIRLKLDWGSVGPCGMKCNETAMADAKTCDASR